jgi:hypothetical protein
MTDRPEALKPLVDASKRLVQTSMAVCEPRDPLLLIGYHTPVRSTIRVSISVPSVQSR